MPPGRAFVDVLAAGLLERAGGDPLALSGMHVLLPTRRAGRALREAFLRECAGGPLLLPRIAPLGDLDPASHDLAPEEDDAAGAALELPPPLPALRRQALLTRLILARGDLDLRPDQAAWLAADLARLLDQVRTAGLGFERLADIVPEELARHWQLTLDFLTIITEAWPRILEAEGALDPADRRNRLLAAQAARWQERPPDGPVVAAGSTGSIPATAALLEVIARLPQGSVLLPGLDREMDEAGWQAIEESHPQFGMKQLLARLRLRRHDVPDWPVPAPTGPPLPDRRALIRETMRPAATAEAWRAANGSG